MNKLIKSFPYLYSRNGSKQVVEWTIEVTEKEDGTCEVTTRSGLLGKAYDNVPSSYTVYQGKNIGKSNQTTTKEQAIKEAEAKHVRMKKRAGYIELNPLDVKAEVGDVSNHAALSAYIDSEVPMSRQFGNGLDKPMLAKKYWKDKKVDGETIKVPSLDWKKNDYFIHQPKFNGIRCITYFNDDKKDVMMMSRNGQRYRIGHIEDTLLDFFLVNPDIVLDGELYIHGEILSEINSACQSTVKGNGNLTTLRLNYVLFDIADDSLPQHDRIAELMRLFADNKYGNNVYVSPCASIYSNLLVEDILENYIENGYEGAIFREPYATYQFGKRNSALTKMKKWETKEFIIINVVPMGKQREQGKLVCRNDITNDNFEVTLEASHEQRMNILSNKHEYIHKKATVKFYERTKNQLPFNATAVVIREDL